MKWANKEELQREHVTFSEPRIMGKVQMVGKRMRTHSKGRKLGNNTVQSDSHVVLERPDKPS